MHTILGMKLLIVDDHPVLRAGLAAMLQQLGADTLVLQACDAAEGLATVQAHADLDAVLLDLMLPGMDGMTAIREFGKRRPDVPVIVLSSSEDPVDVRRALASGALGYIPKSARPETFLSALRFVLDGNVYVPPLMLAASEMQRGSGAPPQALSRLTERQVEVLKLLCRDLSNKEIGRQLGLSDKTVKAHITAIFRTLNVVSRSQAVSAARRAELV
jgi:two-component system, NarL family, nitrate/nitrite response regulator NarL